MAPVKVWRLGALAAIPAAMLVIQNQCFPAYGSGERSGRGLRESVQRALRRPAENRASTWLDSVARRGSRLDLGSHAALITVGHAPAQRIAEIRQELVAELGRLPVRDSSVAVTVVVHFLGWRGYPTGAAGARVTPGWNPCVYRSEPDGPNRLDSLGVALPTMLGQCALAAMYGPPGAAVQGWIRRIGLAPSSAPFGRSWGYGLDSTGRRSIRAADLYNTWLFWSGEQIRFLGCRDGDAHACRAVLESRDQSGLRGDFVWWLATTRREQFVRFWHASGSYEEAAQSSFGEPLSTLLADYAADHFRVIDAGPVLPPEGPLAIATVLLLSFLVSLLLARRRYLA